MSAPPQCTASAKTPLTATLVDLGSMPLANSYVTAAEATLERHFPLHVRVCPACLLVQASDSVPPDAIFSDYAYFSSYADSWVDHARRYAEAAINRFQLGPHSLVIEVGSNDGYLLETFQDARHSGTWHRAGSERSADGTIAKKGLPLKLHFSAPRPRNVSPIKTIEPT